MRSRPFALVAVVLAVAVVTGSGAFTTLSGDRAATVDVTGDATGWLGLEPHSGPNGAYAHLVGEELAIDVSAGSPNADGAIAGSLGVNRNTVGTADRVFNVTNQGTQPVSVWIDDGTDAVSFSTATDDHGSVDGEANAFELVPGRTMEVGFEVDATGIDAGTRLLESITLNAVATGATVPGVGDDGDTDGDDGDDDTADPGASAPEPSFVVESVANSLSGVPGRAYVFTDSVSGTLSVANADATVNGTDAPLVSGHRDRRVSVVGDVNGDGETDYLVGSSRYSVDGASPGGAFMFYGPAAGQLDLSDADVGFVGNADGDHAGRFVAHAGDVNGDGFADLLIAAPRASEDAGEVYLFYGRPSLSGTVSLSQANVTFLGESIDDFAGSSVAGVADTDNDSYDDVLIGAPGHDDAETDMGAVYLIRGAQDLPEEVELSDADVKFVGEGAAERAGTSVAGAGDVDGDGYDDLLIGAPDHRSDDVTTGAAYLVYGGTSLAGTRGLATADATFVGEHSSARAGSSVAGGGDADGDGYDDLLIGAPGATAYLVYGGPEDPPAFSTVPQNPMPIGRIDLTEADAVFNPEGNDDRAGSSVSFVGDLNDDGSDEVLIGAPHASNHFGAVYLLHGGLTTTGGEFFVTVRKLSGVVELSGAEAKLVGESEGDHAGTSVDGGGT